MNKQKMVWILENVPFWVAETEVTDTTVLECVRLGLLEPGEQNGVKVLNRSVMGDDWLRTATEPPVTVTPPQSSNELPPAFEAVYEGQARLYNAVAAMLEFWLNRWETKFATPEKASEAEDGT